MELALELAVATADAKSPVTFIVPSLMPFDIVFTLLVDVFNDDVRDVIFSVCPLLTALFI